MSGEEVRAARARLLMEARRQAQAQLESAEAKIPDLRRLLLLAESDRDQACKRLKQIAQEQEDVDREHWL